MHYSLCIPLVTSLISRIGRQDGGTGAGVCFELLWLMDLLTHPVDFLQNGLPIGICKFLYTAYGVNNVHFGTRYSGILMFFFSNHAALELLFLALSLDLIPMWPLASIRPLNWNCRLAHWPEPHQCPECQQDPYLKLWRHLSRNLSLLRRTRKQLKELSSSLNLSSLLFYPLWQPGWQRQSRTSPKQWRNYARRMKLKTSGFVIWSEMWVIYRCV